MVLPRSRPLFCRRKPMRAVELTARSPLSKSRSPLRMFSSVLLPAPLTPMRPMRSWSSISERRLSRMSSLHSICDIFREAIHFAVTPDLHKIPVYYDTISSGKRKPPARTFPAKAALPGERDCCGTMEPEDLSAPPAGGPVRRRPQMPKLRKMLGAPTGPSVTRMMRLIETPEQAHPRRWGGGLCRAVSAADGGGGPGRP